MRIRGEWFWAFEAGMPRRIGGDGVVHMWLPGKAVIPSHRLISQRRWLHRECARARIQHLSEHVRVLGDPEMERTYPEQYRTIIEVTTRDGRTFAEQVDWPKGYPQNPVSPQELKEKFLTLSTTVVDRTRAEEIADLVDQVENLNDIGELTTKLQVISK